MIVTEPLAGIVSDNATLVWAERLLCCTAEAEPLHTLAVTPDGGEPNEPAEAFTTKPLKEAPDRVTATTAPASADVTDASDVLAEEAALPWPTRLQLPAYVG